jgi:hypothetical protein
VLIEQPDVVGRTWCEDPLGVAVRVARDVPTHAVIVTVNEDLLDDEG